MSKAEKSRAGRSRPQASRDEEILALRLRVAELERELDITANELVTRTARLDALYHSRVWRQAERLDAIRHKLGPDGAVAAGYDGSGPSGVRVPLAGLAGSGERDAASRWQDEIVVAGVALGGIAVDPPTTLGYRITGVETAWFRAFAALRMDAWTRNRGGVRFVIRVTDSSGQVVAETVRDVNPAARREDRRWVPLTLGLPRSDADCELTVSAEVPPGGNGDFGWALLGDPVLLTAPAEASVVALPDRRAAALVAGKKLLRAHTTRAGASGRATPLISVLLPVHDPEPELLRDTLDSVLAQTSGHWQLCVVDDGSTRADVAAVLKSVAHDERVIVRRLATAQGVSAATNAALALARGAYVATLDHDDLLSPDAISAVGSHLSAHPTADALYTDNDKIAAGARFSPSLKPGWSPELLCACMYTLHFSVYRRALIEEIGGWRSEFDGAQDHDLMLRLSERSDRIFHLPKTLYSWRAHAGSAALGALAKPQAYERGLHAVVEHLRRTHIEATAEPLPIAGRFRVAYEPVAGHPTAVVIPLPPRLAGQADVADRLEAIAYALSASSFEPPQVVIVSANETIEVAAGLGDRATLITGARGTWGSLAGAGAAATDATVLVFLEDLCAPLTSDWREELAGPIRDPRVCAASPLVLDANGRVVHAGVALLRGLPLPVHTGADTTGDDLAPELTMVTDRSAAAGVVAITRAALERGGGLDEQLDHLALTSLTARLTRDGERVACSPHAPWRLLGRPRPTAIDELRVFARDTAGRRDPYYNPRLWPDRAAHIVPRALHQTGRLSDIGAL